MLGIRLLRWSEIDVLFESQGMLDEAMAMYEQSAAMLEKALGPEHHRLGYCLNTMTEILISQVRVARIQPEAKILRDQASKILHVRDHCLPLCRRDTSYPQRCCRYLWCGLAEAGCIATV